MGATVVWTHPTRTSSPSTVLVPTKYIVIQLFVNFCWAWWKGSTFPTSGKQVEPLTKLSTQIVSEFSPCLRHDCSFELSPCDNPKTKPAVLTQSPTSSRTETLQTDVVLGTGMYTIRNIEYIWISMYDSHMACVVVAAYSMMMYGLESACGRQIRMYIWVDRPINEVLLLSYLCTRIRSMSICLRMPMRILRHIHSPKLFSHNMLSSSVVCTNPLKQASASYFGL